MKLYSVAIGAGLGYIAGNQQARQKTADLFRQLKASPQAKVVEDKVSQKVSSITDKARGTRGLDLTDSAYGSTSVDAVDPEIYAPGQSSVLQQERPSMVPH